MSIYNHLLVFDGFDSSGQPEVTTVYYSLVLAAPFEAVGIYASYWPGLQVGFVFRNDIISNDP